MSPKREYTLEMDAEDVSCMSCKRNYSAIDMQQGRDIPTFCQKFTFPVSPRAVQRNKRKAKACAYYWPHFVPRPGELATTTQEQFNIVRRCSDISEGTESFVPCNQEEDS